MEQYTIRGFRNVLEESVEYLALSNTEERLECLDKCNWILSFIILTVKSRDKPLNYYVNIHSEIFRQYLGSRHYKEIKDKEYEECFKEPVLKKILNNTAKLIVVESEDYYKEKITILTEQEMDNNIDPNEKIKEHKQRYYRYKAFYNEFKALNYVN